MIHKSIFLRILVLSCILIALGLSSCSSTSDNTENPPADDPPSTATGISMVGQVMLETSSLGVSASASFSGFVTPLTTLQGGNIYSTVSDTCTVNAQDGTPLPSELPTDGQPLSAGETLVVRSGEASYLELSKSPEDIFINYSGSTDAKLPESALSVAITGEEKGFLAFDTTFDTLPPFELTAPTLGTPITADTTFSWTGSSENAVIEIDVSQSDPSLSLKCFAKDDGSFQIPETTKTQLAGGLLDGRFLKAARSAGRYELKEDAALMVVISRKADTRNYQ
ncbi:MAG: hypothetical protein ACRCYY_21850 [Trueperaceae bacterium]